MLVLGRWVPERPRPLSAAEDVTTPLLNDVHATKGMMMDVIKLGVKGAFGAEVTSCDLTRSRPVARDVITRARMERTSRA